ADGLGHVGEECERQRRGSLGDEVRQYQHQWQRRQNGGQIGEADHGAAHDVTTARGSHFARPLETLQTSQRAIPLTIRAMTRRIAPTAMSADRCKSFVASLNSFAISDAIV